MNLYREHPLKIFKHTGKYIWVLIFPIIRIIQKLSLDLDSLAEWFSGVSYTLALLVLILLFGFFRWYFLFFRFGEKGITVRSGYFIVTETFIPYDSFSTTTTESGLLLRLFKITRFRVNTCSGIFGKSNISLLIRRRDLDGLHRHIPTVDPKNDQFSKTKPKALLMVIFSLIFSNSISGFVYIILFLFQTRQITMDLMQNELQNFIHLADSLTVHIALKIPSGALVIMIALAATWLLSFILNLLRYARFTMYDDPNSLKIQMGAITRRSYFINHHKINYIDIRQSLLMKIFRLSSIHISCSGYGNQKNELPVLFPILMPKQEENLLDLLKFKKYKKIKRKNHNPDEYYKSPNKKAFWTYCGIPSYFILGIAAASVIAWLLYPSFSDMILFVTIMLEIPFVWLVIVKITALFSSGVIIEDNFCYVKYSRFFAFHTILVEKDKLVKVQIVQDYFDKRFGRCRLDFYFSAENPKINKIKGMNIEDAKMIIEKFHINEN